MVTIDGLPLRLIPLICKDGLWSISQEELLFLHSQLMYYYGKRSFIDDTVATPEAWLAGVTSPNTTFFLLYHGSDPVMVLYFTGHAQTHVWGHFFWLRSKISSKDKVEVFRWSLSKAFQVLDCAVIVGKTPADNKRTIKYLCKVGFTLVGNIPNMLHSSVKNKPVDASLLYIKREDLDKNENLQPDQIKY